jgi:MOSC domain-containing protein YiiM
VTTDTCAQCGFDPAVYTRDDLLGTLRAQAPIWRTMTEGMTASVLAARPAPDGWSAIEHAVFARDTTEHTADVVDRLLAKDAPAVAVSDPRPLDAETPRDLAVVVEELEVSAARVNANVTAMAKPDWTRSITVGNELTDVAGLVARAVHDTTHHSREAGRGLHALGAGAPHHRGTLVQVNSSKGGVPKAPLLSATIDRRGVVGDRQAERRHHGRPLQALCLWSEDVINALRSEGHAVYAGAAGENLTVAGIDWQTIRPGVVLAVGGTRLEISAFATPCAKNAQWFSDGGFRRIDHNLHPGWSRAYAWVLEGGTVTPGDAVVIEP